MIRAEVRAILPRQNAAECGRYARVPLPQVHAGEGSHAPGCVTDHEVGHVHGNSKDEG